MAIQRIQFRRGTAAQWTASNPVLASGEPGFESDTGRFKIGTGTLAWTVLPYQQGTVDSGGDGAGPFTFKGTKATVGALPTSGNTVNDLWVVGGVGYVWDGTAWINIGTTVGVGVPAGGATGQVLTKSSGADYATQWTTPTPGGGTALTSYDQISGLPDYPTEFPHAAVSLDELADVDAAGANAGAALVANGDGTYSFAALTPDPGVNVAVAEAGDQIPPPGTPGNTLIFKLAAPSVVFGFGTTLGGAGGASVASVELTLTQPVPAGTTIVVGAGSDGSGSTQNLFKVTDTKGNDYTSARSHIQGSTNQAAIIVGRVAAGKDLAAGDKITVTARDLGDTANAVKNHLVMKAITVTNASAGAPVNRTAVNGSTTVASALSVTTNPDLTTVANTLLVGAFVFNSSAKTFTPSNQGTLAGPVQVSATGTGQRGIAFVFRPLSTTQVASLSGDLSVPESYAAVLAAIASA